MSIKQRISKLEGPRGEPTIVYVIGSFSGDRDGHISHASHSELGLIERKPDESQEAFKNRVGAAAARDRDKAE